MATATRKPDPQVSETGTLSRKSRKHRLVRAAILILATAAAALVLHSGLAPGNARLAAGAARSAVDRSESEVAVALARQALVRDATLVPAIEVLALHASKAGNGKKAATLFSLSAQVSRRSLATHVWHIESAVERGDADAALGRMDLALRTSSKAPPLIFPALINGLSDRELAERIARLVDRPSDWREAFLIDATRKADPAGVTKLLLSMRNREFITAHRFDQVLAGRLASERRFALARQVADAFGFRRTKRLVADSDFASDVGRYPFGWGLVNRAVMGALIRRDGRRSVLAYHAHEGHGGQVAAQLLMLPQGRYRLSTTTGQAGTPAPGWRLACGEQGGRMLAQLQLSARDGGRADSVVIVPQGCEAQWLTLDLQPSLRGAQDGTIASVAIEAF